MTDFGSAASPEQVVEYGSFMLRGETAIDVGIMHRVQMGESLISVRVLPGRLRFREVQHAGDTGEVLDADDPVTTGTVVWVEARVLPGKQEIVVTSLDGNAPGSASHAQGLGTLAMNTLIGYLKANYVPSFLVRGIVDHPSRTNGSEPSYENQRRRVRFFERFGFTVKDHRNFDDAGRMYATLEELNPSLGTPALGTLPSLPDFSKLRVLQRSTSAEAPAEPAQEDARRPVPTASP